MNMFELRFFPTPLVKRKNKYVFVKYQTMIQRDVN